jgi:hypothetical protein
MKYFFFIFHFFLSPPFFTFGSFLLLLLRYLALPQNRLRLRVYKAIICRTTNLRNGPIYHTDGAVQHKILILNSRTTRAKNKKRTKTRKGWRMINTRTCREREKKSKNELFLFGHFWKMRRTKSWKIRRLFSVYVCFLCFVLSQLHYNK